MAADVTMKNGMLYSNELRKLAKAMNQRMVELERKGYNSPAYAAVQGRLASLGIGKKQAAGRRFSETGMFKNKNEMTQVEAALKRFRDQETSKLRGYKKYRKRVLKGLQERYNYKQYGMSDDDMMAFWESMPDDDRDRMYGSDESVIMTMKYFKDKKTGKLSSENALTMKEIVDLINKAKSFDEAIKNLGYDPTSYLEFKKSFLGGLGGL